MSEAIPVSNPNICSEAEQSVLGAVLQYPHLVDAVSLQANDFYHEHHRLIWQAIKALAAKPEPIDTLTVHDYLTRGGKEVPPVYLAELIELVPTAAHVEHHAGMVRQAAARRNVHLLAMKVANEAEEGADADDLIDEAEAGLIDIRQATSGGVVQTAAAGMPEVFRYLEDLSKGGDMTGLPTGFVDIDRLTGGMRPGNLVVVAGRPGMGKTALALNVAAHVAKSGQPALIFSQEMTVREIRLRLLSAEGQVDAGRLADGKLDADDWTKLTDAAATFHAAPLFVSDTVSTAGGIRAQARRVKGQAHGLGLVVVDYLQLLSGDGRSENRQTEVAALSRGLKRLALELDCVVMALSQLNRAPEGRKPPKPILADLRESGAIEQDADMVALLYRDEVYDPDSDDRGMAEVHVAKHRNGPTGTVRLGFLGWQTRFGNLARVDNAEGHNAKRGRV